MIPACLLFSFLSLHLWLCWTVPARASSNETSGPSNSGKRGLVYIGTSYPQDYELFTSRNSPLTWYYAFTTGASLGTSRLDFTPMIHGADDVETAISDIQQLAGRGAITHVLVFNEPDGSTDSGGSNISPDVAARTYMDTIAPLRGDPYNIKLSVPATTGSPNGLAWLKAFNASCMRLSTSGCEFDFLAAHWYGDFPAMASWLGTLHSYYPQLPIWLTEFALPAFPENVTYQFVNQSLGFLDQTDWVERYSYFGTFRRSAANSFTGPNVAMLDDGGGLTEIGSLYLGGDANGFHVGDRGSASSRGRASAWRAGALTVLASTIVIIALVV